MARIKPLKEDVVFINPENGEVECTFNTCVENFTIKGEEERLITDYWADGTPVPYKFHFRKCDKCGRVVVTDADKKRNKKNRELAEIFSYHTYQENREKYLSENS